MMNTDLHKNPDNTHGQRYAYVQEVGMDKKLTVGPTNQEIKNYANNLVLALRIGTNFDNIWNLLANKPSNQLLEVLKTKNDFGKTPLHAAASSKYGEAFINALKNFGINEGNLITFLALPDNFNLNSLHIAAKSEHGMAFIGALLKAGISEDNLVNLLQIKNILGETPLDFIEQNNKKTEIANLISREKMQLLEVPVEFQGHPKPKQNMSVAHLAKAPIGEVPNRTIETDDGTGKVQLRNLPNNVAQKLLTLERNEKLYGKLLKIENISKNTLQKILDGANGGDASMLLNFAQKNLDKATFEGIEKEYIDAIKAIQYRQKLCDAIVKKRNTRNATAKKGLNSKKFKTESKKLYQDNRSSKKLMEELNNYEKSVYRQKLCDAIAKRKNSKKFKAASNELYDNSALTEGQLMEELQDLEIKKNIAPKKRASTKLEKDSERIEREVNGLFQGSTVGNPRENALEKKELPDSIDELIAGKVIGEGGFGKVQLYTDPDSGKKYAVKFSKSFKENSLKGMKKEAYVPNQLKEKTEENSALHDIAVGQFASAKVIMVPNPNNGNETIPALIQEAVGEADLVKKTNQRVTDPLERVHLGIQVIAGINALGESGVVHGDLKPGNMRIGKDGLHIIDWGAAVPEGHVGPSRCTFYYSAPEDISRIPTWSNASISASQDVYSVGIILAQVLFGNLCQIGQSNSLTELLGFNITNEKTLISWKTKSNNKITPKNLLIAFQEVNKKLTHSYSEQILAEMAGIIGDCLNYDSTKRPTAAEVYGRWVNVYIKMTDS